MQNQHVKISAEKQAQILAVYEQISPQLTAQILIEMLRMQRNFLQSEEGSGMYDERRNEFESRMFVLEQLLEVAL